MTVTSLTAGDERSFEITVAGPVALIIAKSYKLHDRLKNEGRRRSTRREGCR
jgi:hypothetical protein